MSSDPNTVASLLQRMDEAGLVERKRHEKDRRAHRILLREAGQKKYETARQIAILLQGEVLAVLPRSRREEFLRHLDLVSDACRVAAGSVPRKSRE